MTTPEAIAEYLNKARQAQEKLNEATEQMNRAAQNLCSIWEGQAAQAFSQEQQVLYSHCRELCEVGDSYIPDVEMQKDNYVEAENLAKNAIASGR